MKEMDLAGSERSTGIRPSLPAYLLQNLMLKPTAV